MLFDPSVTTYEGLLDNFFAQVSPFSACSDGRQYATGVWWHDEAQQAAVLSKVANLEAANEGQQVLVVCAGLGGAECVSAVVLDEWGMVVDVYRAEEYHQKFFEKNPETELFTDPGIM